VAMENDTTRDSYGIWLLPAMGVLAAETRGGGPHRQNSMPAVGDEGYRVFRSFASFKRHVQKVARILKLADES